MRDRDHALEIAAGADLELEAAGAALDRAPRLVHGVDHDRDRQLGRGGVGREQARERDAVAGGQGGAERGLDREPRRGRAA